MLRGSALFWKAADSYLDKGWAHHAQVLLAPVWGTEETRKTKSEADGSVVTSYVPPNSGRLPAANWELCWGVLTWDIFS